MKTILYYLGIALLLTHELDAVLNFEWRLLYHLRSMPDDNASVLFVALHFPMILAFFYFGHHKQTTIREGFRSLIAVFLIVHAGLHFRLSGDPLYAFSGVISNFYIYAAAVIGASYLVSVLTSRNNHR